MSSPMQSVYKSKRFNIYWAGKRFVKPGVYVWAFKANRRIVPVPKRILPGRSW